MVENNVRQVKEQKGISGLELARLTKINPSSLSLIERNLIPVYPRWKRRLSEALGVPEEKLFPEVKL